MRPYPLTRQGNQLDKPDYFSKENECDECSPYYQIVYDKTSPYDEIDNEHKSDMTSSPDKTEELYV